MQNKFYILTLIGVLFIQPAYAKFSKNYKQKIASISVSTHNIVAQHSSKCLDATYPSGNVIQYNCHFGSNQLWDFEEVGYIGDSPYYKIRNMSNNQCLTVDGMGTWFADGINIATKSCQNNNNFYWKFVPSTHFDRWENLATNKCLSISTLGTTNGVNAEQMNCGNAAFWILQ